MPSRPIGNPEVFHFNWQAKGRGARLGGGEVRRKLDNKWSHVEELGLTEGEIELLPVKCALRQGRIRFNDPMQLNCFIAILNKFKLNPGGPRGCTLEVLEKEVEHRGSEGATI